LKQPQSPFVIGAPIAGFADLEIEALEVVPNETTDATAKIPTSAIFLSM
jgi:hypothetical protein